MNLQKTGVFIQNARKRMNLSQRMLGEKLSVTSQAVSKWERGLGCPDIAVLKEMAVLFGCSITDILNGEMSTATTQCFMQPDEQQQGEIRVGKDGDGTGHALFSARYVSCGCENRKKAKYRCQRQKDVKNMPEMFFHSF